MDSDLKYFQSIPWTQKLLADDNYIAIPTGSRAAKESTEDAMFAETLNTKNTVQACLTLKKKSSGDGALISEIRFFLSLGYAVNGYPHRVHGGMISLIMDEAMGTMVYLNGSGAVTAYLKTTYLRPIPTPSVIVATAKLRENIGRKIFTDVIIEGEGGNIMATGEGLWIRPRDPQTKL